MVKFYTAIESVCVNNNFSTWSPVCLCEQCAVVVLRSWACNIHWSIYKCYIHVHYKLLYTTSRSLVYIVQWGVFWVQWCVCWLLFMLVVLREWYSMLVMNMGACMHAHASMPCAHTHTHTHTKCILYDMPELVGFGCYGNH